jgi:hypothetical protein
MQTTASRAALKDQLPPPPVLITPVTAKLLSKANEYA